MKMHPTKTPTDPCESGACVPFFVGDNMPLLCETCPNRAFYEAEAKKKDEAEVPA